MTLADAYRRLGEILSGLEAEGIEVTDVTPMQEGSEDVLHVDLRIGVPMAADAPEPAIRTSVGQAGPTDTSPATASEAAGSPPDVDEGADAGVDTGSVTNSDSGTDAGADADADDVTGSVPDGAAEAETGNGPAYPCGAPDCSTGFDSEAALSVHRFAAHGDLDEPIHKHEAALRAAYEAYDSFASMTDALGADVTPQTVRRNMMKFGIHEMDTGADEPDADTEAETDSEQTDDDAEASAAGADDSPAGADERPAEPETEAEPDADSPSEAGDSQTTVSGESESPGDAAGERTVTDGAGGVATGVDPDACPEEVRLESLPADIAVADLREAVVEGGSLRAAAQRLDRSRGATRDLLQEHDLLELVHGRVATRPGREERATAFEEWLDDERGRDGPQA